MPALDGVLARSRAKHATLAASLSSLACVSMCNPSRKDPPMRDSVSTLLEALPYIREFHGRTVVIKYGGAAMEDAALREEFARDVVLLKYVGLNPIVVHGGGPEITGYMERLGLPVQFVGGLRVSDASTVEVAKMVLVGKVNKEIVLRLSRHGQPAVGLCGDDGSLFRVARRSAPGGEDIGYVGRIEHVNVGVIEHVASDYIPVIASVGADRDGQSYNVNADEAAGAVAGALGAYKVIFLTDVPGWLGDPADPASLIGQASAEHVRSALGSLDGGMRPKLEACLEAIEQGVSAAHILDGRVAHSLLLELFTDAGIGTKIEAAP
jgi:acetylglutamate kinase